VTLSKDKYCSATAMLGATAEISWDLELRELRDQGAVATASA